MIVLSVHLKINPLWGRHWTWRLHRYNIAWRFYKELSMPCLHVAPDFSLVVGSLWAEHTCELWLFATLILQMSPKREFALVKPMA